jgi:hypothetical protein
LNTEYFFGNFFKIWILQFLVTDNPTPVMGQQQQMHSMSRVPQQPGQGGSMNLPSMVGPGPGQQQVPGQQAQQQPPPPAPQQNQSGAPSGQQPQNIGSQQTVAAPQQGTPPGVQPSAPQQVRQHQGHATPLLEFEVTRYSLLMYSDQGVFFWVIIGAIVDGQVN